MWLEVRHSLLGRDPQYGKELICLTEIHSIIFSSVITDMIKHENLFCQGRDLVKGKIILRRILSFFRQAWVKDDPQVHVVCWQLETRSEPVVWYIVGVFTHLQIWPIRMFHLIAYSYIYVWGPLRGVPSRVSKRVKLRKVIFLIFLYLVGCNNGIGGFYENLVTFKRPKVQFFYGSKRCASKSVVLSCNTKSGKSGRLNTKRTSDGKPPQIRPSPKRNRSESQCSCIFQESMNRTKYTYMGLWVKYTNGKSSCVPKIHHGTTKLGNNRFRVHTHYATIRFTFEKISPPPPLLHPSIWYK